MKNKHIVHQMDSHLHIESWTISIDNLIVNCFIGIFPKEQQKKQLLCINLRCSVVMPIPIDQPSVGGVVCYDDLIQSIKSYFEGNSIYLLETAAEKIAYICFKERRITKVWIRVEKVNLYEDVKGVGIEITRER